MCPHQSDTVSRKSLTVRELADKLSVSEDTVRREMARGNLRAFRVGRLVRVTERDLDAYVARRTMK